METDLIFMENHRAQGKIKVDPSRSPLRESGDERHAMATSAPYRLTLKPSPLTKEVKLLEPMKKPIEYDIFENVMVVSAQTCLADSMGAVLYSPVRAEKN
jgi:hypothetical protein